MTSAPNTFHLAASAPTADASGRPDRFDVVVIGARQASLAIGHFLARQGRRNSLVLFTSRRHAGLMFEAARRYAMKAIVQDAYGSTDVLEYRDIDMPEIGDDEVLIRVHAAGVDEASGTS